MEWLQRNVELGRSFSRDHLASSGSDYFFFRFFLLFFYGVLGYHFFFYSIFHSLDTEYMYVCTPYIHVISQLGG